MLNCWIVHRWRGWSKNYLERPYDNRRKLSCSIRRKRGLLGTWGTPEPPCETNRFGRSPVNKRSLQFSVCNHQGSDHSKSSVPISPGWFTDEPSTHWNLHASITGTHIRLKWSSIRQTDDNNKFKNLNSNKLSFWLWRLSRTFRVLLRWITVRWRFYFYGTFEQERKGKRIRKRNSTYFTAATPVMSPESDSKRRGTQLTHCDPTIRNPDGRLWKYHSIIV